MAVSKRTAAYARDYGEVDTKSVAIVLLILALFGTTLTALFCYRRQEMVISECRPPHDEFHSTGVAPSVGKASKKRRSQMK